MHRDTAVVNLGTVHRFLSAARIIFAPKLDDSDIRTEVRLEAGGGYRGVSSKDIEEARICGIGGEIGHHWGSGAGGVSGSGGKGRREGFVVGGWWGGGGW